jgi:predicted TIM-barrel fold metal-dependent hydrolase
VSLSTPLGLESLPRDEAGELVDAWHAGALALPDHFGVWASVPDVDPDLTALADLLAEPRLVGVQLAATRLATPLGWERAGALLDVAERAGKPVLVHPGPVPAPDASSAGDGQDVDDLPGWWAPVVDYVQQLHAAWWAWHAAHGRSSHPELRVVFAAAAGLAPLHSERYAVRGGTPRPVDPGVFVDTSGYGPRALDGVVRSLGIDGVVLGSDRPYAAPFGGHLDTAAERVFGAAALHAIRTTNPRRLLGWPAEGPTREEPHQKETSWASVS